MTEIKKVALLGAGAVGAYFIPGLMRTLGDDFCVVAEGRRAERLRTEGLVINDKLYIPTVKTPQEARGADLLLIAAKYDGLKEAFPDIKTIVADNTIVISTMNGIDSEELLAEVIGEEHILYGFMFIASERTGNHIRFNYEKTRGLVFGEKNPGADSSEREKAVASLLDSAGIRCRISKEIVREQWQKYILNVGNNLPQAILGVGYGAYCDSAHVLALHDRLFEEVTEVAKAYGIPLQYVVDEKGAFPDAARFSTLQDLDAGRHTEVEMFAGVLIKKAKEKGISVPFAEFAYHALKALEEKNDGLFDYT